MKSKYIIKSQVNCIEDLKKIYFTMAQKLHPDHEGGSEEEFKILNSEYQALFPFFKDIHRTVKTKEEAEAAGRAWTEFYTAKTPCTEAPSDFIGIVKALLSLDGVNVELCGRWLYINGNTKEHRETLKAMGCKYAPKKAPDMWTWHYDKDDVYKGKRKARTMDYIRAAYGSERYYKDEDPKQLTA